MAAAGGENGLQENINEISKRLNFPGTTALHAALKRAELPVKYKQVSAFNEAHPVRQIFAQIVHRKPKRPAAARADLTQGKFVSLGLNYRWMADLVDFTAQPSISGTGDADHPFQYILVVENIFSKELYARPLRTKDPVTVLQAFKEIVATAGHKPLRLDTDNGSEFRGPFDAYLKEQNIYHPDKDAQNPNWLAPLDRAIQTLKRAINRNIVGNKDRDWANALQKTVDGLNEIEHSSLAGRSPEEVKDDPELQFDMRRQASDNLAHNSLVMKTRDDKLTKKGAFRILEPTKQALRSFQPKFSDKVHELASAENGLAKDTNGNLYRTRHVLPVPRGSATTTHTEHLRGGNALIDRKNNEVLEPFKARVLAHIGEGPKWVHEMAAYMKSIGMQAVLGGTLNYKKALTIFGLHVDDRGQVTVPADLHPPLPAAVPAAPPAAVFHASRRRIVGKRPA